jgi:aminoglycoside/choline kinase family phosphotransferase
MAEPPADSADFIAQTDWASSQITELAGDASGRQYFRLLSDDHGPAILMHAPSDSGSTERFVKMATHLRGFGLSAPEIYAQDTAKGLLLLEDFGDDLFARVFDRNGHHESGLYRAAVDVLAHLQAAPHPEGLTVFDSAAMAAALEPVFQWYPSKPVTDVSALLAEIEPFFDAVNAVPPALSLRDFHAENLIWLRGRGHLKQVGLLDFQDAVLAHPAYDLASLTRDARRDLAPGLKEELERCWAKLTGQTIGRVSADCALIAVQRNLRILGVFARLALRDGKPQYIEMMPRVWGHLQTDLGRPELGRLAEVINRHVPPADQQHLNYLRAKCTTVHKV